MKIETQELSPEIKRIEMSASNAFALISEALTARGFKLGALPQICVSGGWRDGVPRHSLTMSKYEAEFRGKRPKV